MRDTSVPGSRSNSGSRVFRLLRWHLVSGCFTLHDAPRLRTFQSGLSRRTPKTHSFKTAQLQRKSKSRSARFDSKNASDRARSKNFDSVNSGSRLDERRFGPGRFWVDRRSWRPRFPSWRELPQVRVQFESFERNLKPCLGLHCRKKPS